VAEPAHDIRDRRTRFETEVMRNLRWNFSTNMVYGLFGTTGWRMIFTPTFVPAYAYAITQSEFLVGFLAFLTGAVRLLSPFAATTMVEHRRRAKPLSLLFGAVMRLQILLVALAAIFLHETHPDWNVLVFFLAMPVCHALGGMQGVAYGMVMSKVIPAVGPGIWNRNIFVGLRNAVGGFTAIILILCVREYLPEVPFPFDFAYLLIFAFGLTSVGLLFFGFSREPDSPDVADRESMVRKVAQIPQTLRDHPNFAHFVLARSLASLAFLALPFYILHARSVLADVPGIEVNMTLYWMAASSVFDPLWGVIAQRRGFRFVFLVAVGLWIAASCGFAVANTEVPIALAFATIAVANGGFQISSNNMVFEFAESDLRPRMIATSATIGDVAITASALAGGYLAEIAPLPVLFGVAAVFLVSGGFVMWRHVVEPRTPSREEAVRRETPGIRDLPDPRS
jgi:MFS family permease